MADRTDDLVQIADDVQQLVAPRRHTERVAYWDAARNKKWHDHTTDQPSLLDQLRAAVEPGSSGDDTSRSVPASRPPAAMDAIDRLITIEGAVDWWVSILCEKPLRESTEDNLRQLVGLAPDMDDTDRRDLRNDVHRWVTWARTVTGWQTPPYRPYVPCPMCAARGSLRIRLDEQVATCVNCGTAWDSTNIGLLADEIRQAQEQADAEETGAA